MEEDFEAKYQADKQAEQPIEVKALSNMGSEAEAQALGMDKLKEELTELGLK